jgi:hypothetical protein
MVVAIFGVVSIALGSMIQFFYKSNAFVLEETAATESAQRGLTATLQNIREASYGDDGSYPLNSAGTSTLIMYTDLDADSAVERVRYYLLNGVLYRGVKNSTGNPATYVGQVEATSTVATFVKNATSTPIFTYYDSTGAVLSSPIDVSAVRSVGIILDVDLNPSRLPNIFRLSGTATLRNLRTY